MCIRDREVVQTDNDWISKVFNLEETKNANKYRNTFCSLLNEIGLNNGCLSDCAFDNIKPDGGESSISTEYKEISLDDKSKRAFSIIDELKPKYVFTCIDIYEAIKHYLVKNHIDYSETKDGIAYMRGRKHRIKFIYNGKEIEAFQIYHPGLGWQILHSK